MKKNLLRTAGCVLVLGGLASCQSDDIVNPGNMSQEQLTMELDKHFDFKSYKTLPLSLKVSPFENIKLYSVDPALYSDVEPFFTAVANSEGKFNINLPFPGHLIGKTVWAKGNNGVMKATLTTKGLDVVSTSRTITTQGVEDLCFSMMNITDSYLYPGHNNVALVKNQMSEIDITPTNTATGVEVKVAMIDNGDQYDVKVYYYYYTDEDPKEKYGYEEFINKFIKDDAQKFRLFPNDEYTDIAAHDYWMHDNYNNEANIGKQVQLKYYGEDLEGEGVDVFPVGTKIGFALLNAEGDRGNQWLKLTSGGVYHVMYDNANLVTEGYTWENAAEGRKDDYAAAMSINNFINTDSYPNFNVSPEVADAKVTNIVYTFEDATGTIDWDMNDVKMLAIVAGDIKDGIPDAASASGTFEGYYCFEDLYPNQDGGDYDMNDVIVSYEYFYVLGNTVSPNETNNKRVIYFDYVIKPIHDGATYTNDFWLAYNSNDQSDKRATSTRKEIYTNHASQLSKENPRFGGYAAAVYNSKSGKYVEIDNESDEFAKGLIFASVENIIGPTNMTDGGVLLGSAGINPYIYCQTTGEQVHLSKFTYSGPNGGARPENQTIEEFLLKHYLTNYQQDGKYKYCPFAIDIPNCDYQKFTPTPESVAIYEAYPRFVQWVESNGTTDTDWYADTPIISDIPAEEE